MKAVIQIKEHYSKACELASQKVERMARAILQKHGNLDEFIMGMGTWFFSIKDKRYPNNHLSGIDRAYLKPLDNFISEWDDFLKITGEPMRFTAFGKRVTNW